MRERPASKLARPPAGPPGAPDPREERVCVELTNRGADFYDTADESGLPIASFGRLGLRVCFYGHCAPELYRTIAARTLPFRFGTKYVAVDGNTYTWGGLSAASS